MQGPNGTTSTNLAKNDAYSQTDLRSLFQGNHDQGNGASSRGTVKAVICEAIVLLKLRYCRSDQIQENPSQKFLGANQTSLCNSPPHKFPDKESAGVSQHEGQDRYHHRHPDAGKLQVNLEVECMPSDLSETTDQHEVVPAGGTVPAAGSDKEDLKDPAQSAAISCTHCGIHSSVCWRSGPSGPKTLCNPCGLRFSRSTLHKKPPAKAAQSQVAKAAKSQSAKAAHSQASKAAPSEGPKPSFVSHISSILDSGPSLNDRPSKKQKCHKLTVYGSERFTTEQGQHPNQQGMATISRVSGMLPAAHDEATEDTYSLLNPVEGTLDEDAWLKDICCEICGSNEADEDMLLCDGCEAGYHSLCLGLPGIPDGDWFCACCQGKQIPANHDTQAAADVSISQNNRSDPTNKASPSPGPFTSSMEWAADQAPGGCPPTPRRKTTDAGEPNQEKVYPGEAPPTRFHSFTHEPIRGYVSSSPSALEGTVVGVNQITCGIRPAEISQLQLCASPLPRDLSTSPRDLNTRGLRPAEGSQLQLHASPSLIDSNTSPRYLSIPPPEITDKRVPAQSLNAFRAGWGQLHLHASSSLDDLEPAGADDSGAGVVDQSSCAFMVNGVAKHLLLHHVASSPGPLKPPGKRPVGRPRKSKSCVNLTKLGAAAGLSPGCPATLPSANYGRLHPYEEIGRKLAQVGVGGRDKNLQPGAEEGRQPTFSNQTLQLINSQASIHHGCGSCRCASISTLKSISGGAGPEAGNTTESVGAEFSWDEPSPKPAAIPAPNAAAVPAAKASKLGRSSDAASDGVNAAAVTAARASKLGRSSDAVSDSVNTAAVSSARASKFGRSSNGVNGFKVRRGGVLRMHKVPPPIYLIHQQQLRQQQTISRSMNWRKGRYSIPLQQALNQEQLHLEAVRLIFKNSYTWSLRVAARPRAIWNSTHLLQAGPEQYENRQVVRQSIANLREKKYKAAGVDNYLFALDEDTVVDATRESNIARFMNHSCMPNCETKHVLVEGQRRILIYAGRAVAAGEELTFDYKLVDGLLCNPNSSRLNFEKVKCTTASACRRFI
eukprot:gene20174-26910_t